MGVFVGAVVVRKRAARQDKKSLAGWTSREERRGGAGVPCVEKALMSACFFLHVEDKQACSAEPRNRLWKARE